MADNELTVKTAGGLTKTLRSRDLGGGIFTQFTHIVEAPESPVDPTGGLVRYTIGTGSSVALDPPNASAQYARLRVYETTQDTTRRLYYRTDGTAPTNDGANAFGFLLHGEAILVRLANAANFRMISAAGTFDGYVEWLNTPAS